MTTSLSYPSGNQVVSAEYMERFCESLLQPTEPNKNSAENNLIREFYESLIGYVIKDLEPSLLFDGKENTVRMTLKTGDVFEGHVSNWIPHGQGRLFRGGTTYEGRFADGLAEGTGVVKWSDGSWYEGEFQRGLRHGRGLHVSAEDERRWYSGQWTNGKRDGVGQTACTSERSDGALEYVGDWVNGRPHGNGTGSWPDGTRYTGHWVDSRPHGRGRAVWPGDHVYDGNWINGHMDGAGAYEWNSNPRDWDDRVVLCLCDRYVGQWSKSKRHGLGSFYSAQTDTTVHGRWTDDALDGSCEIVQSDGRCRSSDLTFRRNILFETRSLSSRIAPRHIGIVQRSNHMIRADVQLRPTTAYNLTGHVQRIVAAKCPANTTTVDLEQELAATQRVLDTYADALHRLYKVYGAFLSAGPVAYRPLMTRLGLWQMIVDTNLHARVSLADFDDTLYEHGDCAFESAHDPFEPVYYWQFVHAVCELASIVYNVPRKNRRPSVGYGLMASALCQLFSEHVNTNVVPSSYATIIDESWANSRRTVTSMYRVYQTMGTADEPLPTARRLIRLCGRPTDGVLPAVLNVALGLRDDYAGPAILFIGYSTGSVAGLLSQACPAIADGVTGALVATDVRLTFADWYRFVLLCVRDGRRPTTLQPQFD